MSTSGTAKDGQSIFYGWVVLGVALITVVLGYAIRNSFAVFYPTIVEEFGWERGNTALMFSVAFLVYGLASPLAGTLVDRFNPRLVLPLGGFIAGVGVALCSLASAQWQFFLFYGGIAAIGLSLAGWTPLTTIVSNWFVKKRGLAIGILAAGFGGSLISAPIAQFLISSFGWQKAYIIVGILPIAIVVPLCGLLIRRSPQEKGLLPDGAPQKPPQTQDLNKPPTEQGKWAATAWTLPRAMKTYQFWLLLLVAFFLLGFTEQIAVVHQVYFFRDVGYEPMTAANIYSVFGIFFIIGTLCGSLSDRFGRERVFIPSCLLSAMAISLLFLMRDASHLWMPILFAICFGLGVGAAGPVFYSTAADLFQGRHYGSILGTITLGFSIGGAIGPSLAGFIHDKTNSYFFAFFILLGSLISSAVLMWLIAPRKITPVPGRAGQH
jgi:MFS family permease